jgi:hypothetical protein
MENVKYELPGLEAIIFTADGDLRSAVNALQSTASGFDCVDQASVFKVSPLHAPTPTRQRLSHRTPSLSRRPPIRRTLSVRSIPKPQTPSPKPQSPKPKTQNTKPKLKPRNSKP